MTELTLDYVKQQLMTDDRWLYRGLLAIYDRQTTDEKIAETTRHDNGKGFTGADAQIMTSMAEQLKRRGFLTVKQIAYLRGGRNADRARIEKYARQLLKVAEEKRMMVQ